MPETAGMKRKAEDLDAGVEEAKVGSSDAKICGNKKKKTEDEPNASPTKTPQLPAVVWGTVLNFMPYEEVRSSLLVSKLIAVEAAKHVETLNIMKSTQMVGPPARRFTSVTEVKILCLKKFGPNELDSFRLCADTASRVVPFVCMFRKLEKIWVGGVVKFPAGFDYREGVWQPERPLYVIYTPSGCTSPANHRGIFQSIVTSFCGAIKTRNISMNLSSLSGISGGHSRPCGEEEDPTEPCTFCRDVCRHFPLLEVYGSRMCLSLSERYKIIRSRQGGMEFIQAVVPGKMMDFIGCTIDFFSIYNDTDVGKAFIKKMGRNEVDYLDVHYINRDSFSRLDEMIQSTGIDPKNLTKEFIEKRINSHFGSSMMLAKSTFDKLIARGFKLDRDWFVVVDETKEPALKDLYLQDD